MQPSLDGSPAQDLLHLLALCLFLEAGEPRPRDLQPEGEVPAELDAAISDEALVTAARLIRRFHDATAGSARSQP